MTSETEYKCINCGHEGIITHATPSVDTHLCNTTDVENHAAQNLAHKPDTLARLVRYDLDYHGSHGEGAYMGADPDGGYVRYTDAVAMSWIIENCYDEIKKLEEKLSKTKMLLKNERDQQVHEELAQVKAELAQIKAQKPVAWMYVNEDGECEQIEYDRNISEEDYLDPSITSLYAAPASDSLKAENERLREALRPFADVADLDIGDDEDDDDIFWPISNARYSMAGRLRVGDLRKACSTLKGDSNDKG